MKIGILGGSFNPVHDGHIAIANLAIKKLNLDQIWLIPTSSNPFKGKIELSYQKRMDLILQKTKNYPKIKVKNYENCSKSTYEMLEKIQAENQRAQIFFIIGADNLKNLHKWDDFDRLIKKFKIAIFSRGKDFFKLKSFKSAYLLKKYQQNRFFRIRNIDISSTELRGKSSTRHCERSAAIQSLNSP